MPYLQGRYLSLGARVQIVLPQDETKKEYDAQNGLIVDYTPFGGGLLFVVRPDNRMLQSALFEGCELVLLQG